MFTDSQATYLRAALGGSQAPALCSPLAWQVALWNQLYVGGCWAGHGCAVCSAPPPSLVWWGRWRPFICGSPRCYKPRIEREQLAHRGSRWRPAASCNAPPEPCIGTSCTKLPRFYPSVLPLVGNRGSSGWPFGHRMRPSCAQRPHLHWGIEEAEGVRNPGVLFRDPWAFVLGVSRCACVLQECGGTPGLLP